MRHKWVCSEHDSVGGSPTTASQTELAMKASTEGIQMHGGYGYMMDSPMQRHFRDAKLMAIYEGTSEVQRMVISRSLLK